MDLCELGTENLHITSFCKYQINQNRSSGSQVKGGKEKNLKKLYLLNFTTELKKIQ